MREPIRWACLASALILAACGGGTSMPPTAATPPTQLPAPTPVPTPRPTPAPTPTPTPAAAPVARATIGILTVVCDGQVVSIPGDRAIPVGCKVTVDLNLKDSYGKPTSFRSEPDWRFGGDVGSANINTDDFSATINVKAEGQLQTYCVVDGIQSNVLDLLFYTK